MSTTVTVAGSYTIDVDSNSDGVGEFELHYNEIPVGTKNMTVYMVVYTNGVAYGEIETSISGTALGGDVRWQRSGAVDFQVPLHSGSNAVEFMDTSSVMASIDQYGAIDLRGGSLRLPTVTTLPSSPVEGQLVIYNNTSAGWTRIAVYLDGGWRMSASL